MGYQDYYYYYEYVYEAKSFIGNIGFNIPEGYGVLLSVAAILLGLAAFAFVLFAAITIKRARPLGIVAAIAQPVGFLAAALGFISYGNIDFSSLAITVQGSTEAEAMDKLYGLLINAFVDNVMPQFVVYMLLIGIYQAVSVITLIYFIMLTKAPSGKALGIVAMILAIIRIAAIGPIEPITLYVEISSFGIQAVWNAFFNFVFFLPTFLVAIQGMLNIFYNVREKKVAAILASEQSDYAPVSEDTTKNVAVAADKYCPQCGCARPNDVAFCSECGYKF